MQERQLLLVVAAFCSLAHVSRISQTRLRRQRASAPKKGAQHRRLRRPDGLPLSRPQAARRTRLPGRVEQQQQQGRHPARLVHLPTGPEPRRSDLLPGSFPGHLDSLNTTDLYQPYSLRLNQMIISTLTSDAGDVVVGRFQSSRGGFNPEGVWTLVEDRSLGAPAGPSWKGAMMRRLLFLIALAVGLLGLGRAGPGQRQTWSSSPAGGNDGAAIQAPSPPPAGRYRAAHGRHLHGELHDFVQNFTGSFKGAGETDHDRHDRHRHGRSDL